MRKLGERMSLVDKYFNLQINGYKALLQNKDLPNLKKSTRLNIDELELVNHRGMKETFIQQTCVREVKSYAASLPKGRRLKFVQIDNGGKQGAGGRIRKWCEGTYACFPDAMIIATKNGKSKTFFVEFKRVDSKSAIMGEKDKITGRHDHFENQLKEIESLVESGFPAYITNNTIFFKKVILEQIKEFLRND